MFTIHDSGYKRLFSNKTIFRQLIETFVDEKWVKELDFSMCETIDKSFVSEHYKKTESDIIYKVKLHDKEVYIFILIEFQSTVAPFMSLRILNYLTNFYMDYVENNKGVKKLPAVFPIMLYNGDARWTSPTKLSALIENVEVLGRFGVHFEYFKIAENEYNKEDLLKIKNIVSTLFLAESYYDIEMLKEEFYCLFEKESDRDAVRLFLNWFKQLWMGDRVSVEDYKLLQDIYKDTEEVKEMLITAIKREKHEIYQQGIAQGIAQGIELGKKERDIEMVKMMLLKGMDVPMISDVIGLSKEQVLEIKAKLMN